MVQVDGSPVQMVMKHYPPEFKVEAVELYRSRPDATIKSIADDLGVNSETLRNWIRAADGRRGVSRATASNASTAVAAQPGSSEAEIAALRKRVRELEEERDILRRAAKYFAGETRW
jgi:transposase